MFGQETTGRTGPAGSSPAFHDLNLSSETGLLKRSQFSFQNIPPVFSALLGLPNRPFLLSSLTLSETWTESGARRNKSQSRGKGSETRRRPQKNGTGQLGQGRLSSGLLPRGREAGCSLGDAEGGTGRAAGLQPWGPCVCFRGSGGEAPPPDRETGPRLSRRLD